MAPDPSQNGALAPIEGALTTYMKEMNELSNENMPEVIVHEYSPFFDSSDMGPNEWVRKKKKHSHDTKHDAVGIMETKNAFLSIAFSSLSSKRLFWPMTSKKITITLMVLLLQWALIRWHTQQLHYPSC